MGVMRWVGEEGFSGVDQPGVLLQAIPTQTSDLLPHSHIGLKFIRR